MNEVSQKFSIQSYIEKNREKLDESLVSLRIMKEVDRFLDYQKLSNKDLAVKLGYSESYISQLMSGVKNVNVSFINRFEKCFSTRLDFHVYLKNEKQLLNKIEQKIQFNLIIDFPIQVISDAESKFSTTQSGSGMFKVKEDMDKMLAYGN